MRKVISIIFAVLIIAFATVPAFAAESKTAVVADVKSPEIQSPQAQPYYNSTPDTAIIAPKTGFDYAPIVVFGVSAIAFAAVGLVYLKVSKKSK